jgi:pimeloyl-ACP methyl ester carboxylesterase
MRLGTALIAFLVGCAPVNIHRLNIETTRVPFSHDGHELEWIEGVSREASPPLPTVIFLEGDGGQCQAFDEGLWRRFLRRFTGYHRLVRPRTYINTVCDTPAFAAADFAHRAGETEALVTAVAARHPDVPLFFMGSSAGAHLALGYAETHAGSVRGIVNLGGGYHELSRLLPEIARLKDEPLEGIRSAIDDLDKSGPSDAPFWNRNRAFWHQMFFSDLLARWTRYRGAALLVHGTKDLDSVPFATVQQAHERMGDNIELHVVDGAGHDVMQDDVMRRVDSWITQRSGSDGSPVVE